jgi:hypothetical protein
MADSPAGTDAHVSRRDRRVHRSRRRWRSIASFTALGLVLVGFGLVITETIRFGGSDRPSLAGTVSTTAAPGASATTPTTLPGRPCRSPLTDPEPLRLWIGGDSLAGTLGPSLGNLAGATGVVQPQFDSRVSSGLTNPTFFNWPDHAAKEMARLDPEVVVFIIGANDFNAPMNTAAGADGEPTWKADYTDRMEQMLTAFDTSARTVIWIGSPAFKDDRNVAIKALDELARTVAGTHPEVAYVDAYELFTDADGKYASSLAPLDAPTAEPVAVRAGDGVHLTTLGGDRLAQKVFPLIDGRCKVAAQAVPGVVKATIQTEGSTQVVGGNRGGTVQTSPPATSPPQTSPPQTSPPATETTQVETTTTQPPSTTTLAPGSVGSTG